MDISKEISINIVEYLQKKKEQSINDIAKSMSTSPAHIKEVIDKKSSLTPENIKSYLKNTNILFWEFASESISENNIPPKMKKRIQICKELSEHIKKNKNKNLDK